MPSNDLVNSPPHYTEGKHEVIDIIEDFPLSYHLGNAIKYLLRAHLKGNYEQDVKKAMWYIERDRDRDMGIPYISPDEAVVNRAISPEIHFAILHILNMTRMSRHIDYGCVLEYLKDDLNRRD